MQVITARNVNDAYNEALWLMKTIGVEELTRNGKVRSSPTPVVTIYAKPLERMLWDAKRDANPFFHVAEAIWMLAGRNDVEFVKKFAGIMPSFSDDGVTLNGAYGYRWANHFEFNQLIHLIDLLRNQPETRRAVLGMWDPMTDLPIADKSADVPCNTQAFFRIAEGKLHMTVMCRSNDIVWGAYGANAVHMSYLLQYVASAVGIEVGTYTQFSNNWHIYERHFDLMDSAPTEPEGIDRYIGTPHLEPLFHGGPDWAAIFSQECGLFCNDVNLGYHFGAYKMPYFNHVMIPLAKSWNCYKTGHMERAVQYASTIRDEAIQQACGLWLSRRVK
jgi:thymidylate synthase